MDTTPLPNHPIVIAELADGNRTIAWGHPATCADPTNCQIINRFRNVIHGDWLTLTTTLTPGVYKIGPTLFNGITFLNDNDQMFETEADIRPVTDHGINLNVTGCRHCGVPPLDGGPVGHAQMWNKTAGWHTWTQPTDEQIWLRMVARRATRQARQLQPTH